MSNKHLDETTQCWATCLINIWTKQLLFYDQKRCAVKFYSRKQDQLSKLNRIVSVKRYKKIPSIPIHCTRQNVELEPT